MTTNGTATPATGQIIAVVGPSGAGKDTLLAEARRRMSGLYWVQRVITRAQSDDTANDLEGTENPGGHREPYEGVTQAEFEMREARGEFALTWKAHGLRYGLPSSMDDALAVGRTVIFNGSRKALASAALRYPNLRVIHVTAPPEVREMRLRARGREDSAAITSRMGRRADAPVPGPGVTTIDNGGELNGAVEAFVRAISQPRG